MNLRNVPEQGVMYALYMDRVEYRKYKRNELPEEETLKEKLLELHLFDALTEYRYVKTRKGEIEALISDETVDHADVYRERIYTLAEGDENPDENLGQVEIINYITYDENDLMRMDHYRLREVE